MVLGNPNIWLKALTFLIRRSWLERTVIIMGKRKFIVKIFNRILLILIVLAIVAIYYR